MEQLWKTQAGTLPIRAPVHGNRASEAVGRAEKFDVCADAARVLGVQRKAGVARERALFSWRSENASGLPLLSEAEGSQKEDMKTMAAEPKTAHHSGAPEEPTRVVSSVQRDGSSTPSGSPFEAPRPPNFR